MRYAIISDIHANLDALERTLSDAKRLGAERIVCLGDIVGYGPLPAEALRRIRATASLVIAGNHDDAVSGRIDARNFIELAGDAVSRHRETLSREDLAWLKALPHVSEIEGAALAHGDLTEPGKFRYIDSEEAAAANFAATDAALVFVGHTHVPGIYLTGRSGRIYALEAEDFVLEDGKRYIVNVGSVGYPREAKGECYSSYVLYDTDDGSVRFRRLPFTVSSVLQRGRTRGRSARFGLLVGISSLALLAAVILLVGRKEKNKVASSVPPAKVVRAAPERPMAERTLGLDGSARKVRANLKLERNSPAAQLSIAYYCESNRCGLVSDRVVKKCTKLFPVPKGATRAVFSIQPAETGGARPVILEFAPAAE